MKSSAQLELETEEARARVNNTLDELRTRTTPGQLVDQVIDYARDTSSGEFFNNLSRQVVNNPMPVVLLGASLAWLAIGQTRHSAHAYRESDIADETAAMARDASVPLGDRMEPSTDAAREAMRQANAKLGDVAQSASNTFEEMRERASDAYARATHSARRAGAGVAEATTQAQQSVTDLSRNFVALCKEQPILMAGIGVALGAAIGALLPSSTAENRLMGKASDDVKLRARRIGDRARQGAQAVYREAKDSTAQAMGPTTGISASAAAELGHS
jgi:ElaB/YqjD/DUF883 family membrane-anchored ribosome-binding protein